MCLGGATVPWGTDHWPKAAGLKPESCSASSRNAELDDPACLAPGIHTDGNFRLPGFPSKPGLELSPHYCAANIISAPTHFSEIRSIQHCQATVWP